MHSLKRQERSWTILLGSCLSFRCRTPNVLRPLITLRSLITFEVICANPVILSFLPSPQPRTVGLCAAHLTASLGLLPAALSWSVSPLSALRSRQVPAALSVFQKSAYQTSGLHPVRDFRVSNIRCPFLSKWSKSHFGSSWLLEGPLNGPCLEALGEVSWP